MELCRVALFEKLSKTFPELVSRKEACKLTGHVLSEKTLRNLDCANKGPAVKHRIGNKICYEKTDFLNWFIKRSFNTEINLKNSNRSYHANQRYSFNRSEEDCKKEALDHMQRLNQIVSGHY
jgi:hypothetical protein